MSDGSNITSLAEVRIKKDKRPPLMAAVTLMREHHAWNGVLAFNEFTRWPDLRKPIPGSKPRPDRKFPSRFEDTDDTDAALWLQKNGVSPSFDAIRRATALVAQDHAYHPVREFLRSVAWDGTERCDTWLIDHLGVEDTPLNRAFGKNFMLAAVARVECPGCMSKYTLTLEGPQDIGKSKAVAALVPDDQWFRDRGSDLRTKDSMEETRGIWIVEFGEFANMRHGEVDRIKAYLSSRVDDYRPSYGHHRVRFERQWTGAATINPGGSGYLRDETGNIRFCPVKCGVGWEPGREVDTEKLTADRDQLWAEALARFNKGEHWWIDDSELRLAHADATEARGEADPREPAVRNFLEGKSTPWTTTTTILTHVLSVDLERQDRRMEIAIGRILHALKWVRHRCQTWGPEGVGYYYFPPGTEDPAKYAKELEQQMKVPDSDAAKYLADATTGNFY